MLLSKSVQRENRLLYGLRPLTVSDDRSVTEKFLTERKIVGGSQPLSVSDGDRVPDGYGEVEYGSESCYTAWYR